MTSQEMYLPLSSKYSSVECVLVEYIREKSTRRKYSEKQLWERAWRKGLRKYSEKELGGRAVIERDFWCQINYGSLLKIKT